MALLGIIGGVTGAVSSLGGFLQSSDPVKDKERMAKIDAAFSRAVSGDQGGVDCLNDIANKAFGNTLCGVGSQVTIDYAKQRWAEYQRLKASGAIQGASGSLNGALDVVTKVSPMVMAVVAGLVVVWLLKSRR